MKSCPTLAALAAAACFSLAATQAVAQAYPNRPSTRVVPFAPGGQVRLAGWTKDKFDPFIDKEMVKWKKLIETSGAKAF